MNSMRTHGCQYAGLASILNSERIIDIDPNVWFYSPEMLHLSAIHQIAKTTAGFFFGC